MENNTKEFTIMICESMKYDKIKELCNKICELGYECEFTDNGNIIFMLK